MGSFILKTRQILWAVSVSDFLPTQSATCSLSDIHQKQTESVESHLWDALQHVWWNLKHCVEWPHKAQR